MELLVKPEMLNVGPYIYDVSISGFTRSSIYIYEISSVRVKLYAVTHPTFTRRTSGHTLGTIR